MRWHDKELNNPKIFDSKDLSEDTQRIRTDLIRSKLEEETQKEKYQEEYLAYKEYLKLQKKKRTKILISAFFMLIIVGLLISFFVFKKYSYISDMENEAEKMINTKKYEKAGNIYKKLYEETDNPQYIQKYRLISSIIDNKKMFREAEEDLKQEDYENAIGILLSIHSDNSNEVEKINDMIISASENWLKKIRNIYISGNIQDATIEINKYVNMLPDNVSGSELRNVILNKNNASDIIEYRNSRERDFIGKQNNTEIKRMYEIARPIIGSNQSVKINNSNVNEKPENNSKVIDRLKKNQEVYIQDIFISGTSNIWCKVYYHKDNKVKSGWISYKIILPSEKNNL